MKVPYGSSDSTKILDDNGSTETVAINFYGGGQQSTPIRHRYRIKQRVKSQAEEHEAYMEFSDQLQQDPTMLDPAFEYEKSKKGTEQGYYIVIKCYTKLEY